MRFSLGAFQERVDQRVTSLVTEGAAARIWRHDAAFWGGDAARHASVANRLGWLEVATQMREAVAEIAVFAAQVKKDGFTDAVVLGMGGSSLAPEVLRQSIADHLREDAGWPRLHILDTTDPAAILGVSEAIDVARTLFFVSSKSGTTIEALSLFAYFHDLVERAKPGRAGENFVAITDSGTPLQSLADERRFRDTFVNPGDIGGRYSALSYFGLVPAAVAGVDIAKLLDRGVASATTAREPNGDALRLGAAVGELALAGRDKCTFVVSPQIASFGLWVEQLIAESTGKEGRGILPVASEPLGTPAHYGDDRLFMQLRLNGAVNEGEDAFIGAIEAACQPVIIIELDDVYDLGRAFFTWEFAIAIAGQVLGINPFDEPNVQESKDNTNRVLKEFEATGKLDVPSASESGITVITSGNVAAEPAAAIDALLDSLTSGDYLAITAYVPPSERADGAFNEIRTAVRDARRAATTLGYGPRFLHSTGQLHKGGPAKGVFLQVTVNHEHDITIPDRPFTFGQLNKAQSIGDFQSLVAHGRPVLRFHLGGGVGAGLKELVDAVQLAVAPHARAGR